MRRIDVELVARGLAPSRSAAQRLIADGAVFVSTGAAVTRPSIRVHESDPVRVVPSAETRYVSRAGAKLEHALARTGVQVRGRVALDVGMSTGGFADCLLRAGAVRVVGIEVGHGQLHPALRSDPRVRCHERTNARDLTPALLAPDLPAGGFPLMVADLSFISLTLVLPALDRLLAAGAAVLLLVKPQFELGADRLDGRGVVVDAADRQRAIDSVSRTCATLGWNVHDTFDSGLPGGDGNIEHFLHASRP
jgi:23S rRNA (cytidine1920-2'-O)/16S rRNA (cytidine1409-2'-O)-methyltransferase